MAALTVVQHILAWLVVLLDSLFCRLIATILLWGKVLEFPSNCQDKVLQVVAA